MNLNPDPVDVEVGRRICSLRLALGRNQSELGRAVDKTFQQIQKYEKGSNRVSASVLYKIAQYLGVEPAHFFPAARADGVAQDPATALGVAPNGHELARLYVAMDPGRRTAIIQCARSLAGVTAEAA